MNPDVVLILGCGFTGSRVAQRLQNRGIRVVGIRRSHINFEQPGAVKSLRLLLEPGCVVLHSIPTLQDAADQSLVEAFGNDVARVVYLSTTGVYGDVEWVDEHTPARPGSARELARASTENAIASGAWQTLILRPAAIYGPGRGVHVAMAKGRYTLLGDGSNYISRIHVDDLAAISEAAILSDITGAYPVADRHPCPSREIAEYCAKLLGLPMPAQAPREEVPESRRTNRRVDGSAILRELGVELRYPSYREGIPASISEDSATMEKTR